MNFRRSKSNRYDCGATEFHLSHCSGESPMPRLIAAFFIALPILIHANARAEEPAASASQTLLHATSPYEDMVKCALARNDADIAKYIAKAELNMAVVKGALKPDAAKKFESQFDALRKAAADKSYV